MTLVQFDIERLICILVTQFKKMSVDAIDPIYQTRLLEPRDSREISLITHYINSRYNGTGTYKES